MAIDSVGTARKQFNQIRDAEKANAKENVATFAAYKEQLKTARKELKVPAGAGDDFTGAPAKPKLAINPQVWTAAKAFNGDAVDDKIKVGANLKDESAQAQSARDKAEADPSVSDADKVALESAAISKKEDVAVFHSVVNGDDNLRMSTFQEAKFDTDKIMKDVTAADPTTPEGRATLTTQKDELDSAITKTDGRLATLDQANTITGGSTATTDEMGILKDQRAMFSRLSGMIDQKLAM